MFVRVLRYSHWRHIEIFESYILVVLWKEIKRDDLTDYHSLNENPRCTNNAGSPTALPQMEGYTYRPQRDADWYSCTTSRPEQGRQHDIKQRRLRDTCLTTECSWPMTCQIKSPTALLFSGWATLIHGRARLCQKRRAMLQGGAIISRPTNSNTIHNLHGSDTISRRESSTHIPTMRKTLSTSNSYMLIRLSSIAHQSPQRELSSNLTWVLSARCDHDPTSRHTTQRIWTFASSVRHPQILHTGE